MKMSFKPGTMIYPLPAVMVSCGDSPENYNIMTAAWVGTICTNPPMCYVSLRKERYSHEIISRTKEFVINVTTEELALATDWCGVRSGRDYNKRHTASCRGRFHQWRVRGRIRHKGRNDHTVPLQAYPFQGEHR